MQQPCHALLWIGCLLLVMIQPACDLLPGGKAEQAPQRQQPARTDRYGDPLPQGAVARLGTVRFRQSFIVNRAVFSPDGQKIASSGRGGGVCVWDSATGRKLFQLPKPGLVSCVAFSPDGKLLASEGESNATGDTLRLVDAATGKELRQLQGNRRRGITSLAFSPDGKTLALASYDTTLLWEVATGKELHQLRGHQDAVSSLAFSPDGRVLAAGSWDNTVHLWETATGKKLGRLTDHQDYVSSVAFSADGITLASASADGTVRLWDVATRKQLRVLARRGGAHCVTFSPAGGILASGNSNGTIALCDGATGKETRRWQAHTSYVLSIAFSPDGKTLVSTATWDSGPRLWDVATGKEIRPSIGHHGPVHSLAFSHDGKALFSGGMDKLILRWDPGTGREEYRFHWHSDGFDYSALSPDGKTVATWSVGLGGKPDYTLRLWDAGTGKEVRVLGKFSLGGGFAQRMAFSPDGSLLAAPDRDRTVHLWQVATGKEVHLLKGFQDQISSMAFSPDGKALAVGTGGKNGATIRDVATEKELRALKSWGEADLIAFSPNGKVLALVASYGGLTQLWDVDTGKALRPLIGTEKGLWCLAFSPDGKFLAGGGIGAQMADHTVYLWEASPGEQVRRFQGHVSPVWSVAFAPDGRTLASGGSDSMILLWDVTGRVQDGRLRGAHLTAGQLDARWADLTGTDGARACDAIWALTADPRQALPFLAKHLHPVAPADPRRLARLIADLDSNRFTTRQKATDELGRLADLAEPALRQVLRGKPSPEVRRRIEQVLAQVDWRGFAERLRT
ncbi:MAG TPA: WD40 repeat domain-containing protein, partial [Gemmataceae bacterium]|nr:WD40 repeat domain-containing protein [Gemmataceae bacterium]